MQSDKTAKARKGEELDTQKLDKYLKIGLPKVGNITNISQFPGGFSNLTYLVQTENADLVLRRPPLGASIKSGHDMGREFRVLSALQKSGFTKIPKPLSISHGGFDISADVPQTETLQKPPTPASFYLMQRLNGVILRAQDGENDALTPDVLHNLSEKWVENLAHLHSLDIENTDLGALGKPEGYVKRQVDGWIKRYRNSQTDDVPNMEMAAAWLAEQTPRPQKPTFLHNDYKFDNMVWNADLTEIIGVLDWEMATVGDPLMDLGAALAYWCEAEDSDFSKLFNLTWRASCPNRQYVASKYADLTGRDLTDIAFYYVFGLFKNAVIMQQIYARWKKGLTKDPRFEGLILGVFELSKMAKKTIKSGEI
ncbi:MAG: phosphotransferase family protein [Saprospiraceae bacterium]|nr:phosphotransferase family protein [Saprospiraceae bacterium]